MDTQTAFNRLVHAAGWAAVIGNIMLYNYTGAMIVMLAMFLDSSQNQEV